MEGPQAPGRSKYKSSLEDYTTRPDQKEFCETKFQKLRAYSIKIKSQNTKENGILGMRVSRNSKEQNKTVWSLDVEIIRKIQKNYI